MKTGWNTIGHVGVDSGSLIIADPCYLDGPEDWNPKLYEKWICGALCQSKTESVEINEMCHNQAVAFSSGFGDGVYEVKALYKNYGTKKEPDVRIAEVRIILIGDDNYTEQFYKHTTGKKTRGKKNGSTNNRK